MLKRAALLSWIVSGAAAIAQAQPAAPTAPAPGTLKFDVASVRVVDPSSATNRGGRSGGGGKGGGGRAMTGKSFPEYDSEAGPWYMDDPTS